jgi:hypothetical protein
MTERTGAGHIGRIKQTGFQKDELTGAQREQEAADKALPTLFRNAS